MSIVGLDHIQLAARPGCETQARRFFGDLLLLEIEKPEALTGRGESGSASGLAQGFRGASGDRPSQTPLADRYG